MIFSLFMNEWLYSQDLNNPGYYLKSVIGKKGDFYTSVSTSKFFGGSIAYFLLLLLEKGDLDLKFKIVEIGSHDGNLISDIAEFLSAFNMEIFNAVEFITIEPFLKLQTLQKNTFQSRITTRFNKELIVFEKLQNLNNDSFIFFISNELLDSFIVDIMIKDSMFYVDSNKAFLAPINPDFKDLIAFKNKFKLENEVSLFMFNFIRDICNFNKFIFLTFDYGDFYPRDLNLRMYQKNRIFNFYEHKDDLSIFFKNSDITCDVNFALVNEIFQYFGAELKFFVTQSKMLVEKCNILDIFEAFSAKFSPSLAIKQRTNIAQLIAPNKMGERFKAICIAKK